MIAVAAVVSRLLAVVEVVAVVVQLIQKYCSGHKFPGGCQWKELEAENNSSRIVAIYLVLLSSPEIRYSSIRKSVVHNVDSLLSSLESFSAPFRLSRLVARHRSLSSLMNWTGEGFGMLQRSFSARLPACRAPLPHGSVYIVIWRPHAHLDCCVFLHVFFSWRSLSCPLLSSGPLTSLSVVLVEW